jgi:hypothetical protein
MPPKKNNQEPGPGRALMVTHHYAGRTPDGLYHAQNTLGPYAGQHHVHTEKGYLQWSKEIDKRYLHLGDMTACPCELEPGYVREHDGTVWFNKEFE